MHGQTHFVIALNSWDSFIKELLQHSFNRIFYSLVSRQEYMRLTWVTKKLDKFIESCTKQYSL
jgi:hypothetical protein